VLTTAAATLAATTTLLTTLLLISLTTASLLAALLTALILFRHFSPSLFESILFRPTWSGHSIYLYSKSLLTKER
jgi:hypothetical protein